jgi:hypothetical protein
MMKLRDDGEAERHGIDTSFGPEPKHFSCDCPDLLFRRAKDPYHCCRHVAVLAAICERLGIDATKGA